MTADPAADQRQGRPRDCTSPSFSSHHEAAWRRPRREARAPCGVIGRSAKGWQQKVIRAGLDTGRDREAVIPFRRSARRLPPNCGTMIWF